MDTLYSTASRYRWIILLIGVLAQITFAIGFVGVPVSGVLMREDYQFTLSQLGFVLGCMGLGVAISEIAWGVLTDKLGDKIVLMIGLGGMGAAFLAISLWFVPNGDMIPSYISLGVLLILAGSIGGSINSASGSAVMTWFQDHERGFAMSIRQTAIPVGGAIGSVTFPFIVAGYGFGAAFLSFAVLCFAVTLLVWFGMKVKEVGQAAAGTSQASDVSPLKRMSVWNIALAGCALTFPQMAVLTFAAVFLTDEHHLSMGTISLILFGVQLGGGALRIITGRLTDKYKNRRQVLRWIAVIAAVAGIVLGLVSHQNTFVVVTLLAITGLAGNAWHGIGYTEIAVAAGVRYAGTALGMMGATVFIVSFVIPYMIPIILGVASWTGVWIIVGITAFLAFPLLVQSVKKIENKEVKHA